MGTIQLEPVYPSRDDLSEEERERLRREEERARASALDVMESPYSRDPEGEQRAARIAAMDPEDWARERDGDGPIALPEQTVTGRPAGNAPVETPETVLSYARQRAQGTRQGLGRIEDDIRTPDFSKPRQQAVQESQRRDRAVRDVVQNPRDPAAARELRMQLQGTQQPSAQVQDDPGLREALSEAERNRKLAAIAALLTSATGNYAPGTMERFQSVAGDPVQDYMTRRGVRTQDQSRSDRLAQQQAQLAQRQAEQQRRAQMDERTMRLREQSMEQRQPLIEAQTRSAQALATQRELEARAAQGDPEAERALTDPQSEQSQRVQTFYLDTLARSQGLDTPDELDLRLVRSVRGMSARQLNEDPLFQRRVVGEYAAQRSRPRGGGGGGGSRVADMRGQATQALVDAGRPPEEAQRLVELMGPDELRRTAYRLATSERAGDAQREILPGVRASIEISRGEAADMRETFAQAANQFQELSHLGQVARSGGAGRILSPEARAEVESSLPQLRAMVANLQQTGVINVQEAPMIEAALPDPRSLSQLTFGTLQVKLRSFQRQLEASVANSLRGRGVDEQGVRRALSYLRSHTGGGRRRGPSEQSGQPGDDMVLMEHPTAGRRYVPRSQVETYRRRGAEVVGE